MVAAALGLLRCLPLPVMGGAADAKRRNAAPKPLVVAEALHRPALRGAGVRGLKAHVVSAKQLAPWNDGRTRCDRRIPTCRAAANDPLLPDRIKDK